MSGIPFERDESCADRRINASCDYISEVCTAYAALHIIPCIPCALSQQMRDAHVVRLACNWDEFGADVKGAQIR